MKNLALILTFSLITIASTQAEETSIKTDDYDKQFEENMKEMTTQLQSMTAELIKYMDTLNKNLDTTMPQMTKSMSQVISAMKPVATTMQKNMDNFVKELNQQLDIPTETNIAHPTDNQTPKISAPEKIVLPEEELEAINLEIDKELADFAPPASDLPQKKIKLFPSTVE
ncbi:MAG: hypothetical protein IJ660_03165 [Alphaproteobacteria bacterium]|nr:hypothetical protein [Alphaproteobacteria bacterium]